VVVLCACCVGTGNDEGPHSLSVPCGGGRWPVVFIAPPPPLKHDRTYVIVTPTRFLYMCAKCIAFVCWW
jgi:hypothetical protein